MFPTLLLNAPTATIVVHQSIQPPNSLQPHSTGQHSSGGAGQSPAARPKRISRSARDHECEQYVNKFNAFTAGILSGVTVAGAFNPWDRALYLSVVHERPFFASDNWRAPYTGFWQVLLHRTLTSGLYYPLFDIFKQPVENAVNSYHLTQELNPAKHGLIVSFLVGTLAGAFSGVLLNPLTAVKYSAWDTRFSFFKTCRILWREGGYRPFLNALGPTVVRDTLFGGFFSATKFIVSDKVIHESDSERSKKIKVARTVHCGKVAAY